ncbi:MAG TPA: adenylyl-sulfate kinase, partial [Candidatus Handelsmanbacteria bacterium]|nr:adenylyl-sulfate kinase [Candidatus Handelsmanbacteria bacterium]
ELCEQRDPKGLYKKARSGEIPNFTGISDPYEPPTPPELEIRTAELTVEAAASLVLDLLEQRGKIATA